jgi:diguanylate cyclase (GGDEF)-like protein
LERALNYNQVRIHSAADARPIPDARLIPGGALGSRGAAWAIGIAGALGFALLLLAHVALSIRSFFSAEAIAGVGVLFAGALPGMLSQRRIRHIASLKEDASPGDGRDFAEVADLQGVLQKAEAALSLGRRNHSSAAVLLIDLNQFQKVNDRFGRSGGDQVVRALAQRLNSATRAEDVVARLAGDEFVVMQVGSPQPSGARSLASRLVKKLSQPYEIGNEQVVCESTIGVAVAPTDGCEWETLLACAESACKQAKSQGACSVCFHEPGMDASFGKHEKLESEMRRALDTEVFQLAFQPVFSAACGKLVGFETLLRWPAGWEQHSPSVFIPAAEECGLMVPIGTWVLETACRWAAAWTEPLKVSVNLSPAQFHVGNVVAVVERALMASGLDAARLELEVTENLWLQELEGVTDQLTQLQAMGVSIVLDDFGTGSSSLSCLWKFPFNAIKIDRSLISEMTVDAKSDAIVRTILAVGKTLNLQVTAVGVETRAQADALIAAGCDRLQGYLYGRPLSATAPIL